MPMHGWTGWNGIIRSGAMTNEHAPAAAGWSGTCMEFGEQQLELIDAQ